MLEFNNFLFKPLNAKLKRQILNFKIVSIGQNLTFMTTIIAFIDRAFTFKSIIHYTVLFLTITYLILKLFK